MNIKKYINFFDTFHQKRIFDYVYNLGITDIIDVGAHEGEFLKSILKLKKLKNCLLKIDTEGYELNVLKGSVNKIQKEIKFILIEKQFFKQYENNNFQDKLYIKV